MITKAVILFTAMLFTITIFCGAEETAEQHAARMAWWKDAKFGMFIHWGLYAQSAGYWNGELPPQDEDGRAEWIMQAARPSVAEYAEMTNTFNPSNFNADQWIAMAKDAGVKYIVFTAKHHEGFAMFRTKVSPFNIVDATPFKRDPLRELADACKKHDIKLGIYYSQAQDWHHPGGLVYRSGPWDDAQHGDFNGYLKSIAIPQIKELLTNYGTIAELWWDTPGSLMSRENSMPIYDLVKQYQPQAVMNNRLAKDIEGDISTPEGFVPATGLPNRDWESCMPMANTWGYHRTKTNYIMSTILLSKLIDAVSKGGNFLLNVSPMDTGEIPAGQIKRMQEIGRWMKINSEAIYGTKPTIFGAEAGYYDARKIDKKGNPLFVNGSSWRCTTKDDRIYIHFLKYPKGTFVLNDVAHKVTNAFFLADQQRTPLQFEQAHGTVTITLPAKAPDKIIPVLAIDINGPIVRTTINPLAQDAAGAVSLAAVHAEIVNGGTATPALSISGNNAVLWTNQEDYLRWNAVIKTTNTFAVFIRYAMAAEYPEESFVLQTGENTLSGVLSNTKNEQDYKTVRAGAVDITATGVVAITLKQCISNDGFINLQSLLLVPVKRKAGNTK